MYFSIQYIRQLDSCFGNGADFPKLLRYLDFWKSYLIPETTNSGIGEGIVNREIL